MSTIQNVDTIGQLHWLRDRHPNATLEELIVHTASYTYAHDIITQAGYRVTRVQVDTSGGSLSMQRVLAHYENDATSKHLFQQPGAKRRVVHDELLARYGIDANELRTGAGANMLTNFNIYLDVEPLK